MRDFDLNDHPFEFGAVLPEQFFPERNKFDDPIERLMFAILTDAIRCYQNNIGVQQPYARHLFAETREWLFRLPGNGPFSFENICELLEIDAPRLRRALRRWRDRKLSGREPQTLTRRSSHNIRRSRDAREGEARRGVLI